jgi:hypothetical protein
LRQTAPTVAPKRAHDRSCRLCGGVGYVKAPPTFVRGNLYEYSRECSCWSVQS